MAAQPKKKHSKARTGKRRWVKKPVLLTLSKCPNCSELKRSHQVCTNCGYFKGHKVI